MDYQFESSDQMWAAVEYMLDSEGWKFYIVPSLETAMRADMVALSAAERGKVSDDFLRGRINLASTLLNTLPIKLREYREEQQKKSGLVDPDGQPIGAGDPYEANSSDGQPVAN